MMAWVAFALFAVASSAASYIFYKYWSAKKEAAEILLELRVAQTDYNDEVLKHQLEKLSAEELADVHTDICKERQQRILKN